MTKARAIGAAGAVTIALLVLLGMSVTASAAKAPRTFFGVVPQTSVGQSDFERMGNGKVGTVRITMSWPAVAPNQSSVNDWSSVDPIVLEAAANGIEVLPFIFGTPSWVAKGIDNANCSGSACVHFAPKSTAALEAWKTFVGDAVERYGPNGEFWAQHPDVPEQPIRAWQIWNEQNSKTFYGPKPSAKGYAKLLGAAHDAIDAVDPSADVVLGGMAQLAGSRKAIPATDYLEQLYAVRGVKSDFEAVAPHPYGATIGKVSSQVDGYRDVMKAAGDSGASMYVTEIGAGSASGGNSLNRGTAGQATLLKEIYKYFLKQRKKMHVEQVDWFSWQDNKQSICSWCASSGLLTTSDKAKKSYKEFTKLSGGRTTKR